MLTSRMGSTDIQSKLWLHQQYSVSHVHRQTAPVTSSVSATVAGSSQKMEFRIAVCNYHFRDGKFSCESEIWEHSAQCTRLEENHQLRLNSSIPRTEVHCLLGPQSRNSTEDRDFLFSRHIKCTSLKGKGGKGWKRRATWLI